MIFKIGIDNVFWTSLENYWELEESFETKISVSLKNYLGIIRQHLTCKNRKRGPTSGSGHLRADN